MTGSADQRRNEVRAVTELGLTEISGAARGLHRTHRAVSDRVFGALRWGLGRSVIPVQAMHDAVTDGVYTIVAETTAIAGEVGGRVADLPMERPPSATVRGAALISTVNGLIGDELDTQCSPLADEAMTVRVDGRPVSLTAAGLADAFPAPTGRIAVLVHGLVETEHAWRARGEEPVSYPQALAEECGVTTVFLRYHTGRHISTNGQDLAELLDDLVRCWPVPVDEMILIGHSMGGLVLRSAAYHGGQAGHWWPRLVTVSVSLGTPHLGAPLESLAHHGAAALTAFPETSSFGRLLRRRSSGIRDLRAGALVDDDWSGRDPDDLARVEGADIPLLATAEHYFVSATVTSDPAHPVGRLVGDGLVLHHSAAGESKVRRIGFDPANGMHLGRSHHFTLLADPRIAAQLVDWVGRRG